MVRTIRRSYFGVFVVSAAMALLCVLASVAIAAPANDNFANAQTISGESASVEGTNINASTETGEAYNINGFITTNSVWYSWTSPVTGVATVDTCYTEFDSVLSVHTGSTLDSLTMVAADDDGCVESGGTGEKVTFDVTTGATYYIRVASAYPDFFEVGNFILNLESVAIPPPANDNFADAEAISGRSALIEGTTAGATREVGEPDHYTSNFPDDLSWLGDHSVWYRWTAPVSGTTTIDTCTTNIDSILAVYTGSVLETLSRVADNNNDYCGGGWGSNVAFKATEGTTYQIAVSDAGGLRRDTFTLNLGLGTDNVAPNTTLGSGPSGSVNSTAADFGFFSSEPNSTFECSLDGSPFASCTSPKSYSNLSQGDHTFQVRAIDTAGNIDAIPSSRTWTVDTPPNTTISSSPSGYVKSTSASFSFSSSEVGSTFKCSRDGSSFSLCTSPKSYSSLSQGSHTFRVRAIDKAGNIDATPASRSWFVDNVVPKGTISINGGNASTSTRSVTLRLSASDPSPPSGMDLMSFRNGGTTTWTSWTTYATSKSWTLTAGAGTKTVYVQYRDHAGNISAAASDTIKFSP